MFALLRFSLCVGLVICHPSRLQASERAAKAERMASMARPMLERPVAVPPALPRAFGYTLLVSQGKGGKRPHSGDVPPAKRQNVETPELRSEISKLQGLLAAQKSG